MSGHLYLKRECPAENTTVGYECVSISGVELVNAYFVLFSPQLSRRLLVSNISS